MKNFILGLLALLIVGCTGKGNEEVSKYQYIEDVRDSRIGTLMGSAEEALLEKRFPNSEINRYENITDMLQALKQNKIDAIGFDGYATGYLNIVVGGGLTALDDSLGTMGLGAAFPKGKNVELRQQFNAFIKSIKESGLHTEIVDKWTRHTETAELMELDLPTEGNPVKAATCMTLPPTSFLKGQTPVGLDIELLRLFSVYINRPIEIVNLNFTALITSLSTGKTDMVLSALNVTEERAKAADFSDSYMDFNLDVLVRESEKRGAEDNGKYKHIKDLGKARVATLMGSVEEFILEDQYPDMTIERYETLTDMVQALKQHRVEGISMDGYAAPHLNLVSGGGMVAMDDSLGTLGLAAAVPKDKNKELREAFNQFMKSLKESGEHEKIMDKWINHSATAQMPDIELPTEGTPIRVATCPTLPPTSYLKGNENVGFDMEILFRFAQYINRPVHIQNLNFASLITALVTGKADIVVSSLIVTEERAKAVDFTDSYMDFDMEMLVRTEDKTGLAGGHLAEGTGHKGGLLSGIKESFYNNLILEKRYEMVWNGLKTTLIIAFLSAIFGTVLGAFICFLKMRKSPLLKAIANTYINLMRGMPVLVLLLIMFYVVFNKVDIDPVLVSVITFAMNFAAYVSEMFRTSIEGVDRGQTEAGIALGFTKFKTFIHIVLPQAFKNVLPVYKGEMISMVKMTSIVGYIAVEDLTRVSDIIRSRTFDALFPLIMVAILYFIIAWLFTQILDYAGRKVN